MVPALAVTAAFAEGETVISHAERLHLKECDRLLAMEAALKNLGADIKAVPDGLIIHGKPALTGGKAEGMNDHRVVMALPPVVRAQSPSRTRKASKNPTPDFSGIINI